LDNLWIYGGKVVRGDANGDGEVGMPDVMFITNYILGSPATSFSIEGADANLDGEVDNNDVKNIVDYILKGKQWEVKSEE